MILWSAVLIAEEAAKAFLLEVPVIGVYLEEGAIYVGTVSVEEAASNFAVLLARVTAGEEIVIARQGKPVARLARVENSMARRRIPDLDKGKIWVSPDFDDPLPEFEKEFYGE